MKADIAPSYWDTNLGKAIGRTKEVMAINSLIDTTKATIFKIYRDLQERESNVTSEKVKNSFLGLDSKHEMLLELFQKHNADVFSLIGKTKAKATYQKYEVTRKHMASFVKSKYNLSDVYLGSAEKLSDPILSI
ncbi:hypothetical protein AwDysgo_07950 [Bacteroidales bacterium]|nr:hypothetical protein AwDysgo_07950 [Bacteroidales bacterium]